MTDNPVDKIVRFPGAPQPEFVLRFRVNLVLMPAPVWRQFLMPGECSFWDLHVAIQDAFGWEDRHLHQFTLDHPGTGERLRFGIPDDSGYHGVDEILPGWEHPIAGYFREGLAPALYTYDLGDQWQHEVCLEGVQPYGGDELLPACLAGAGACPHEDCGGPAGWEQLAAAESEMAPFDPLTVVFDNPRTRWLKAFGHE